MNGIDWIFAATCGQNPAHTWAPGGELLPFCQRCTGLYVGACLAAVLHGLLKPRMTGRFLEVHGFFLLVMVPFGYHWVPQGPVLRTVTGVLFGAGVVTFLLVSLKSPHHELAPNPSPKGRHTAARWYFAGLVLTGALTVALGASERQFAGVLLTLLGTMGVLTLVVMVGCDIIHFANALWRLTARRTGSTSEATLGSLEHSSPAIGEDKGSA